MRSLFSNNIFLMIIGYSFSAQRVRAGNDLVWPGFSIEVSAKNAEFSK